MPSPAEASVWSMETINVQPEELGPALGYLDDNWMRLREEAKSQGAIVSYHRFVQEVLIRPPGEKQTTETIVLLTQYKNQASYDASGKLFAPIRTQLGNSDPGVLRPNPQKALYQSVSTTVFREVPDVGNTRLKLVAKQ